jgi:hypothetical protein
MNQSGSGSTIAVIKDDASEILRLPPKSKSKLLTDNAKKKIPTANKC